MFTENSVSPFYALNSHCEKQRNLKAPSNLSLCFSLKVSQKQTMAKILPSWLQSLKPNLKSYAVAMKWKPLVCPSNMWSLDRRAVASEGLLLHATHWTRFTVLLSARPLPFASLTVGEELSSRHNGISGTQWWPGHTGSSCRFVHWGAGEEARGWGGAPWRSMTEHAQGPRCHL